MLRQDFTEAAVLGVFQAFMPSMTTMGVSEVVFAPTPAECHTLNLVFCTGIDVGDLGNFL